MKRSEQDPSTFSLDSGVHLDYIREIAERSKTPSITIHFEILDEAPQRVELCRETDESGQSSAHLLPAPPRTTEHRLYGIASYAKILINVAFARLIHHHDYQHHRISWDHSACDLFNNLRRKHNKSLIKRLWGNPSLRQLLSHVNGFAPMNRYLFAPDGTCVMTEEEFLMDGAQMVEDRYKTLYPNRGWQEYSNGNHIFAAILLQEILDTDIHGAMKELLFDPMGIPGVFFSKTALAASQLEPFETSGYRISPATDECVRVPIRCLDDAVESASIGVRSRLEDIAIFNRELLKGIVGEIPGALTPEAVTNIFLPEYKFAFGGSSTLAGLYANTDTTIPGEESSNNDLRRATGIVSYKLGRRHDGSPCTFYYKGGTGDGFAISMYLLVKDRAFLIVLCNSSGPLDPTDHIARYILHEAFGLHRKVDFLGQIDTELALAMAYIRSVTVEHSLEALTRKNTSYLSGTYAHTQYSQKLYVDNTGGMVIGGSDKTSSMFQIILYASDRLCIHAGEAGFTSGTWFEWKDLCFQIQFDANGASALIGNAGRDIYKKI